MSSYGGEDSIEPIENSRPRSSVFSSEDTSLFGCSPVNYLCSGGVSDEIEGLKEYERTVEFTSDTLHDLDRPFDWCIELASHGGKLTSSPLPKRCHVCGFSCSSSLVYEEHLRSPRHARMSKTFSSRVVDTLDIGTWTRPTSSSRRWERRRRCHSVQPSPSTIPRKDRPSESSAQNDVRISPSSSKSAVSSDVAPQQQQEGRGDSSNKTNHNNRTTKLADLYARLPGITFREGK